MGEDIESTYKALDSLLKDHKTFKEVVSAVFKSIDKDGSGTLEVEEIQNFISTVCVEMNIKQVPDKKNIIEVFKELDEDKSNTISEEELGKFLRVLFEEQKKQLSIQMMKK